jgi:hypothetical protein
MPRPQFNMEVVERHNWLQTLSLATLQQLAKDRGISSYMKMTSAQLVSALTYMDICVNPLSTRKTDQTIQ